MKKEELEQSKKPNITHQVIGKTLIDLSCLNEQCYLRLVKLVRSECERAIQKDNQVSIKSILKELSKEYEIHSLRYQIMNIVVAFRQYMDEDISRLSSLIALKKLEKFLNMYGVEEVIKQGIMNAEKEFLEELAFEQVANLKRNQVIDLISENQELTGLEHLDQKLVQKYFKELCNILIIIDRYDIEEVVQVILKRYQTPVLTEGELLPLLEAYQFMTTRLSNIKNGKERREILKPILRQRLEAFGVKETIINRVWEQEYGESH